MAEQTEYLADHPEVKQLIADYTQTLLVGNLNWINIVPILLREVILCIQSLLHVIINLNFAGLHSKT